ncbi:UPF0389 protein CG9231 [Episyrphus balteatus]|uniref:UPF0389 protein CG9231 n=1 Tax=Episyrphus balteatus TaxID=286459 RepID=UPI002485F08C|nr:UPF0389 protein CG9231 [Episyrphus balteatus]XP_055845464.1 UPF0389 protein CG9231 [Episyrphus balteatus]
MIGRSIINLSRTRGFLFQRYFSLNTIRSQQQKNHTPDKLERRFLVWTGKYKSLEEVPGHVSFDEMERCRNRIRIRLANIMMALTVVGCIIMIISGKQAAKRGESVAKMNLDWHKEYNKQAAAKEEGSK